jgi:uncharacterized protein YecT (DUF1311 family)
LGANAHAQSFDCTKATTPVERAICASNQLRNLDDSLAHDLKAALSALPDHRQRLLADQRRWLAYRDRRCRNQSPLDACLIPLYKARVAHLQAYASAGAAICRKVADGYSPSARPEGHVILVNTQPPQYSPDAPFPWTDDPIRQLQEWSKAHNPPFIISQELMDALNGIAEETGTIGSLDKLPDSDIYSVTHEQGSAHCLTSRFFAVQNGTARPVESPRILEDLIEASCGARRSFTRIDGTPVLIQHQLDRSPYMSDTTVIVAWEKGQTPSGCALKFSYAPEFGPATYLDAQEVCEGPLCEGLRSAAREIVAAVQKSPKLAREHLQSQLTEPQRNEYDAAVGPLIRDRGRASEEDPADITDFIPMRVPYVYGGKLYIVSLGHFQPHGRVLQDWSVKFESLEAGKLVHSGTFAVGMRQGDVEDISISLQAGLP